MDGIATRIERIPRRWLVAGSVVVVALPLAGTLLVQGTADLALAGVAAVAAAGAAWIAWLRRQLARLPLELSPHALRGPLQGGEVYRFRVRLGRGRPMHNASAEVSFVPESGEPVPLVPVLDRAECLVGPWTIAVSDQGGQVVGPGRFEVRARVEEGGRTLEVSGGWARDDLVEGRFHSGFTVAKGRLCWEPDAWDEVVPLEEQQGAEVE